MAGLRLVIQQITQTYVTDADCVIRELWRDDNYGILDNRS